MFLSDEIHSLLCQSSFNNKCQNTSKEQFNIALKKHVYVDHCMIAKILEEKINNMFKDVERQPRKKKTSCKWNHYLQLFCCQKFL